MYVEFSAPTGTDLAWLERKYPDLEVSCECDPSLDCFIGSSAGRGFESAEQEYLTYDEAVECCGLIEGFFGECNTLIEGNGGWAQSMMRRKDFSAFKATEEKKREWRRTSRLYWTARAKGEALRKREGKKRQQEGKRE